MSYNRIDRISEEVRREVDRIIREDLSDPRVAGTFSVTRAEVTRVYKIRYLYLILLLIFWRRVNFTLRFFILRLKAVVKKEKILC